MALDAPAIIPSILQVVCAWAPTFAFMLLHKKLVPGLTLGQYVRQQFRSKISFGQLLSAIGLQVLVLAGVVALVMIVNKAPLLSVVNVSASALILGFFNMLIRGPLGEELGWRGYALNHLQKTHSPLASSLIVGVVWGFWHTPLWIVTSGYTGGQLIAYCALFLTGLLSISVIITFFYNKSKNLLIPIVIHQLLNYTGSLVNADGLQTMLYQSLLCLVVAIALVAARSKQFIQKPEASADVQGITHYVNHTLLCLLIRANLHQTLTGLEGVSLRRSWRPQATDEV
jgi:membrane protease YdiL (CAAX protease family)